MTERLSKIDVKKYYWKFFGSLLYITLTLVIIYFIVDADSFYQYSSLPPIIEHNRAIFIVLAGPLLFIFIFFESLYCLITRTNIPERYTLLLGKPLIYLLFITVFGITPAFSIGGSIYLEYQGYTRCPTHNPSPFNRWQPVYAKSLEHCPELKTKTPRSQPRSSRHDNAIAAIPFATRV